MWEWNNMLLSKFVRSMLGTLLWHFFNFLNYINRPTLVIISSYYEQAYIFVFEDIFVFKHISPCLIDKSVVLVHLNIYMQSVINIMIIVFFLAVPTRKNVHKIFYIVIFNFILFH